MFTRSALLHLRIPFSVFLMPVYWFAWAVAPQAYLWQSVSVFLIIHVLLYPASNGYNSYFDKDTGSIGGLEHPPEVDLSLYWLALLLDAVAILLGLLISWPFALMLLVYGLVSKAYSHPSIRIKKYPVLSWLTAGVFQGGFTLFMIYMGLTSADWEIFQQPQLWYTAALATLMFLGFYPLTQIYQHDEDASRGDHTISLMAGVRGTFVLSGSLFLLSALGFTLYLLAYHHMQTVFYFFACMGPVIFFFSRWMLQSWKDPQKANFRNTMTMNLCAGLAMAVFFLLLGLSL